MKKLIIPCIMLILTFILAISVSAESLPALHPAENIQTGVTEQMVAALTKTVPHIAAPRREAENRLFRG